MGTSIPTAVRIYDIAKEPGYRRERLWPYLTNVGQIRYSLVVVIVNIAEAKAQLSQLAARASRGEEIILARHGQPVARIVPLEDVVAAAPHRGFGIGRRDFTVPLGFDDPLPDDVVDLFEADNVFPT